MGTPVEEALDRWQRAGLVDGVTADAIRSFEAGRSAPAGPATSAVAVAVSSEGVVPDETGSAGRDRDRLVPDGRAGLVAEGLAYLGAALAFGAGLALFGQLWVDLGGVARTMVAASGTLAVAGAAAALGTPRSAAVGRLSSLLAALAVVGTALTIAVGMLELTDLDTDVAGVVAGLGGLAAGVPVHRLRASWPTTLALGGSLLTAVFATQELLELLDSEVPVGTTLMGLGLAWAALGWAGHVRPRSAFEVTGLLAGGVGVQVLAFSAYPVVALVVGLVLAGAVLAVGMVEERTGPAVLGGLGTTVFAPQLVFELFGDTIGGPLALFVGGISLVAVAVMVLRQRVAS